MIRILVDSSSDFSKDECKQHNVTMIPLKININQQEYLDGINLEKDTFYDLLIHSEEFPKTSQPSPQAFLEFFEDVKAKNDECICILLSGSLSGTCQSARLAKEIVNYDKIYIVDSLSVSHAIKLLVLEVSKGIKKGWNSLQIVEHLEDIKHRIVLYASVDTLEYLYRGGRLDKASYVIGGLAKIKPIITINEEGKVDVVTKVIGMSKVVKEMAQRVLNDNIDENYPVYTLYTSGITNLEKLENKLQSNNINITSRTQIGPAIGAHIGPEAYGIIFIKKN